MASYPTSMRHLFKQISASTFILSSIIGILYLATLNNAFTHNVFNKDDEGWFVTMGLNIVEFATYSTDSFPTQEWGHHGTWPPVFPAILAGTIALFGTSALPLKAAITLMALANLVLLLRLLTRMSTDASDIAKWTVVLTAASPVYFLFSHTVMTEIPFMLFCTATLLALQKSESRSAALVAGLFASLAFFTRGYAILFLPTCVICFASQRKRPVTQRVQLILAFSVPLLISASAWWLYTRNVIETQKLDWITATFSNGTSLRDLSLNPVKYLKEVHWFHAPSVAELSLPALFWPLQRNPLIASIAGCLIGGCVVTGVWISRNDGTRTVASWAILYSSFLIYSGMGNPRYWLTCLPFYLFFSLVTVKRITAIMRLPAKANTLAFGVWFAVFAVGFASHLYTPDRLQYTSPFWKDFATSMSWARQNLPQNAVLVSRSPHLSYSSTGRRSLMGPSGTDTSWLDKLHKNEPEIYVIAPTSPNGNPLETFEEQKFKPLPNWVYEDKHLKKHYQLEHLTILKYVTGP